MSTSKTEAKIVVTVEDEGTAALKRIQARFDAMHAPLQRMQTRMARPLEMAGASKVTGALGRVRSAMEKIPMVGALFAAGGMAMATRALVENSLAAQDALGHLNDLSQAYKVGVEDLQVYAEIGADSGVALDDIAKSMGFLQERIAGARSGNKADIDMLWSVGVDKAALEGDLASIYATISDVYKTSTKDKDKAMKVAFAKDGFGKAGISMIPMLEEGGAKFGEVMQMMIKEGRLFSKAQIAAADATGDAWGNSMRRVEALRISVGLAMTPMLESMTESINKLMNGPARAEIVETFARLGQTIAQSAPQFIAQIPRIVEGLGQIFKTVRDIGTLVGWDKLVLGGILFIASPFIASTISMAGALAGLTVSLVGFVVNLSMMGGAVAANAIHGIRGIGLALRALGFSAAASWAMALGPILLIGAALAGVAYAIYANWGGIKAFFGGVWEGFTTALAPVAAAFEPVMNIIRSAVSWVGALFESTNQSADGFGTWAAAGKAVGESLAQIFKAILTPVMMVVDAIKLASAAWDAFNGKGFNFQSSTAKLLGANPDSPYGSNSLPTGQIAQGRSEFSGKMEIAVTADGRPTVTRVESNNKNIEVSANSGAMFAAPAP